MAFGQDVRLRVLTVWMVVLGTLVVPSRAAFVQFSNCLDSRLVQSTSPRLLQLDPLNVTAFFDVTNPRHLLNVTVYGNVSGQATVGTYPPPSDPSWTNPNDTFGKIVDLADGASLYTTLFTTLNVLSYTPYQASPAQFCNTTVNEECPIAPSFYTDRADLSRLPGFAVSHDMNATYAFAEIVATLRIQSGYTDGNYYACVNAYITPDLGTSIKDMLRYLPLGILVVVGIATITAAMFSPWSTWDIFRWSSNSGRDEDVLRLVTPGFADCLQYLQFVVLTGSLSLNYPGFYQPAVSRVGWSSLLFNESLVSGGNGNTPVVDGIYQYRNGSDSGLDRMTQLIGMTSPSDAWADMMVWLVVIVVSVVVLTQVGFALRWVYRKTMSVPAEDLRSKDWYFTMGNVVRITIGYFLFPLVAISMYQFVIASQGPVYSIVLAAIVLLAVIAFAVRLVLLFVRTRPRSYLFDDLQTVLAYGPLYNTYNDDAATFALIPVLVNFLRGIAVGAVQASGIAQIVLLAISEVCLILTINAFRPYPSATSMNLYHTCFSVIRVLTILLSVAFVPSLNVSGGSRGWIGYAILLIHACVLVFGFFLNAIQTLIEVIARLAGAGGTGGHDAARGGLVKVFGVRQLSRRVPRGQNPTRHSMASSAAMLQNSDPESKEIHLAKTRSRSISASSTMLLESNSRNPARMSQMYASTTEGQTTPDAASTFSRRPNDRHSGGPISPGAALSLQKQIESKDPYYRPPRRNTMDLMPSPSEQIRPPFAATEWPRDRKDVVLNSDAPDDSGEGRSTPARGDDYEENELTKTKTDYAVREVDFYYGVRGPALSSGTRKLKTGPADPTGPVSSATGWFKGLLGGRQKEKSKGFEVVRSARAPPPGLFPPTEVDTEREEENAEPYRDEPSRATPTSVQNRHTSRSLEHDESDDVEETIDEDGPESPLEKIPAEAPSLPLIDTVGGIELPSRIGSEASKKSRKRQVIPDEDIPEVPIIPRRSSRRASSTDPPDAVSKKRLSTVDASPSRKQIKHRDAEITPTGSGRLPFTDSQPLSANPNRFSTGAESNMSSVIYGAEEQENQPPLPDIVGNSSSRNSTRYADNIKKNSVLGSHAAPHIGEDRPSSVGYVREHRASDGITHQPHIAAGYEGRSAEIHGAPPMAFDFAQAQPVTREVISGSAVNPYGQPGQRKSRFRD